jgi:hypothetical protein
MVLNLLGALPWGESTDHRFVGAAKAAHFPTENGKGIAKKAATINAKTLVGSCSVPSNLVGVCVDYMAAVYSLDYNSEPDYTGIRTPPPPFLLPMSPLQ